MNNKSLTTRTLDFWLLGGASLLLWLIMTVLQFDHDHPAIKPYFNNTPYITASLALVINYPHFLASYKLAYTRNGRFIRQHPLALLLVPSLLLLVIIVGYMNFDKEIAGSAWERFVHHIQAEGFSVGVLYPSPYWRDFVLGLLINLMFFTVGWHYTKQTFGCMMVYAHYDHYTLTKYQRLIIRYALLSVWWLSFIGGNISQTSAQFWGFHYMTLDLPDWLWPLSKILVLVGLAAIGVVLYQVYQQSGKKPSPQFLVAGVALYVWWLPWTRQADFYGYWVPFFHSLQYLAFVHTLENNRLKHQANQGIAATAIVLGLLAGGWLIFEYFPHSLDMANTQATHGIAYCFLTTTLFINIHHYFIDHVLWRMSDPHIRRWLIEQN
ncbi:hypothetical protein [Methylomicrobium sp. Wu6]|uniref:hypothetical protein n=1 Tax=Methylomicrobium sp. Wu6 TaxID=3107928 RepID=UPI002DD69432|nr:hypothetical protein [Methylomicrobium sp. Wu6]MEC4747464.1 hypothetical protein [Methylomicrobium sp. Wu6]